jgi:hypothetical protein
MNREPIKIKMTENPSTKDVVKIPLPPLNSNKYDIDMTDDIYIKPDNDSVYKPIENENNSKNNP